MKKNKKDNSKKWVSGFRNGENTISTAKYIEI